MSLSPYHQRLSQHALADGMPIVYDMAKSKGNTFVDKVTGDEYLDVFSFFASGALGHNHSVFFRPEVESALLNAARVKPALSDIYTEEQVAFVETIAQITPKDFVHHFFIEGGALAVENALKAAFDWKVKKNLRAGRPAKGSQIIHFKEAFHGRSGYTLSLTNTNSKIKTEGFPQFEWPRIESPAMEFPCTAENLEKTCAAEEKALDQIRKAFRDHPDDIAAVIIEPIQSEGGDRHFREEFLAALRELTLTEEALLIFDEVQTGVGLTGKWWCCEHFAVVPDIIVFGKKMQVCGLAATKRLDEIESVFQISSRINSTFGGNLTDMVRATWILKTIEEEKLIDQAHEQGEKLLKDLLKLKEDYSDYLFNVRGRGLMVAFDCVNEEERNRFVEIAFKLKLLILPCGALSVRLRPFLIFDEATRQQLVQKLNEIMKEFIK